MASHRANRASRSAEQPDSFGFKAIRDELEAVLSTLGNTSQAVVTLQARLEAVVATAEEEIARRTRRIDELEGEIEQLHAYIERLRLKNGILRARAQQAADSPSADLQAQIQALQAEREGLAKTLKYTLKYNHYLLGRIQNNDSMASTSPRTRYTTAQSSMSPKTSHDPSPVPGPSRAPREPPLSPMDFNRREGPRQQFSRAARVETIASDDDDEIAPNNDDVSEITVEGPRDQYVNYTFDAGPPPPGEEPNLRFEFKLWDIANAAKVCYGPMNFERLQEALVDLKPETVKMLEEMDKYKEAREFQLCCQQNMLFVLDPIFLESPSESFMITWMTPEKSAETREELWSSGRSHQEYHTIVRLEEQDGAQWYYIGKLRWSFARLPPQWPKYIRKLKEGLAHALHRRWKTDLKPEEISGLIEDDKFQQFCIQLSSDQKLEERSREYARKRLPGVPVKP